MTIAVASDHGGAELKNKIAAFLKEGGHDVTDCGTFDKQSCDYPDYAYKAAKLVSEGVCRFGIAVCTTGIGVSIAANKVKGIRCALCLNADMAEMSRRHNDANMIALGAKYTDADTAEKIVEKFLTAQFEGGRHCRRVEKLGEIEREEL